MVALHERQTARSRAVSNHESSIDKATWELRRTRPEFAGELLSHQYSNGRVMDFPQRSILFDAASDFRRLQGLEGPAGGVSPKTRSVPAPETTTSGQGKTGRMRFSLGDRCTVACRNGPAGMRGAALLVLRGIRDGACICGLSAMFHQKRERVAVENGLDSFKMIDSASSYSLVRFRRRLTARGLVVTRMGGRLKAIIYTI